MRQNVDTALFKTVLSLDQPYTDGSQLRNLAQLFEDVAAFRLDGHRAGDGQDASAARTARALTGIIHAGL